MRPLLIAGCGMNSAPCGKICEDCPLFGKSCDGCEREMSYSFSYHCQEYDRPLSDEMQKCTGTVCRLMDGKACLCPLIVQKSLKPNMKTNLGPETPVE